MARIIVHIIVFSFLINPAFSQTADELLKQGNDLYKKADFKNAEMKYTEALKLAPGNAKTLYNLANSQYRNARPKDAIANYQQAIERSDDDLLKQKAFYNKGTLLAKQKEFPEAVDELKKAIRLNTADEDIRQNLQRALNELQKQQQQKQQDDKKKDDKKDKKEEKQKPPPPKLSKQQLEQLLKSVEQQEKQVQEKMQQQLKASDKKNQKDW